MFGVRKKWNGWLNIFAKLITFAKDGVGTPKTRDVQVIAALLLSSSFV
jgi:hypothetical protein